MILSYKQLQILRGLSEGKRVKEISSELHAAYGTVSQWVEDLREQMDSKTLPQMVAKAVREKIIE